LFWFRGGGVGVRAARGDTVDHSGWDGGFALLIGACLLAIAFLIPTLWHTNSVSTAR